jgi:hypothetical protein
MQHNPPTPWCETRSAQIEEGAPAPVPVGQEDLRAGGGAQLAAVNWYGLILQSAPGTVALARFPTKPSADFQAGDVLVLDADPLTPGKNGISVGAEPIALATDDSGCFAVTANAGSCDTSVVELSSALAADGNAKVSRFDVKNAAGQMLSARPAAMTAQPTTAPVGQACPAMPTGIVYIAYPSCHLVAAVDVSRMTVVAGVQYDAAGVPTITDGNVTCAAECGASEPVTPGVRPVTLSLRQDDRVSTRRLAIGADNSASITMVELSESYRPLSATRVALSDPQNDLGITDIALSSQIGIGGSVGVVNDDTAPGGQAQYVYAVANDGTVRVADVLNINKECDTQVDPRFLSSERSVARLSCLPVGDPLTPRRRPGVRGPGIVLNDRDASGRRSDGVPTSVTFVRVLPTASNGLPGPQQLVGHFAVVSASSGNTFVVNVDDDEQNDLPSVSRPLESPIPLIISHQLRDAATDRQIIAETGGAEPKPICAENGPADGDTVRGGPRLRTQFPSQNAPTSVIAAEKIGYLPSIQQVLCEGSDDNRPVSQLAYAAPIATRAAAFPDIAALERDEQWSLTWEGSLSLDNSRADVDGPAVRQGLLSNDNGTLHLRDGAKPFCAAGVEPYDIAQVRGCDPTATSSQCSPGYECVVHPESPINVGVCLQKGKQADLLSVCRNYMVSSRRFGISQSTSGDLTLIPRKRLLRATPLSGCISEQQCTDLALVQATLASGAHPSDDTTKPPGKTWTCEADVARAGTAPRCVMTCQADKDCDAGTVCEAGRCMESVLPPVACLPGPQRFELRAGESFAVVGQRSGYIHNIVADSAGRCVADATASPLLRGRIPLVAPPCTSDDPTQPSPNPCSTTVTQTERKPVYKAGTCQPAEPASTIVSRPASAIRFSGPGMTFNLVDPTYPGDAQCRLDRGGNLVDVPNAFSGYAIAFAQVAGQIPLQLNFPLSPSYPSRVVTGPSQSIWVIDEGDFLSTSQTQNSTKGKVFRVESQSLGTVNTLQ